MKELHHVGGTIVLDDSVAVAIEKLASALASVQMSATIRLRMTNGASAIQLEIGQDHVSGKKHVLHAKPSHGEGSHLGLEDI